MSVRPRWIPLLLLAVVLVPAAFAGSKDNSTEDWLNRMNVALHTLNYEGNFVYIHDNHMETMRITHRADADGGKEHLISLTGPQREVIRDHKEVRSIIPENHSVLIERRYAAGQFPSPIQKNIYEDKLRPYYVFKDLGDDRIAGHLCKIISIEPRDGYRYGYRLWLDEKNAMLLRSDLLTQKGVAIERVMFTSISFPQSIPDSAFKATEIKPGYIWNIQGDSGRLSLGEAHIQWKAVNLPPGFVLTMDRVQKLAGIQRPVRHLVFSDGLSSVSVFVKADVPGHHELLGPSRMEAISAFGRQVGSHNITVVGEVPPETVELIAESMKSKPNS